MRRHWLKITGAILLALAVGSTALSKEIITGFSSVATATDGTGGAGDVVGPASSVDESCLRMDGVTGKLIQDTGANCVCTDAGACTYGGLGTFNAGSCVPDNQKVKLGGACGDSELFYDGTDTFLDLNVAGTGDFMIAQETGRPSPDPGTVHVWWGDAGAVTSIDEGLALESNTAVYLHFIIPNVINPGIVWATPAGGNFGAAFLHIQSTNEFSWRVSNAVRLKLGVSSLAFQQDSTISTTSGSLRFDAAGTVRIEATTGFVSDGTATFNAAVSGAIDQLVSFDSNLAIFPSTAPAAAASRNGHSLLAFDDTTDENVIFETHASEDYDNVPLTVEIHWVAATATSNSVVWNVAFERIDAGGLDIDADSFAAVQSSTDATNATSGIATVSSIAFTQAQADGITAGDAMRIKVTRDADNGSDNMTGDAQILRVSVFQ